MKAFTIKDHGYANYFLGIKLLKTGKVIYANQRKYALDILSEIGLTGAKPTSNPAIKNM